MESGIQTRSRKSTENMNLTSNSPRRSLRSNSSPGLKPLKDVSQERNGPITKDQNSRNAELSLKPPRDNNRRSRTPKRSASPHEKEPERKRKGDRKSKRRSSFVRGRITDPGRGLLLDISSDLGQGIPCDVPPDERLDRIASSAIEYTLGKMRMKYPTADGMQQLLVKVRDASKNLMSSMKKDGLFSSAVKKTPTTEESKETAVDLALERATSECKVLRREVENWEKLLEERKLEAEQAVRTSTEIKRQPITEPPPGINTDDLGALDNRPDYDTLLANIQAHRNDLLLFTEELGNGVQVIKNFLGHADSYLRTRSNMIEKETFAGIEGFDDPQNMIAKIIDPTS